MYWWHILHVKKSDMLYKVYSAHKISQFQGDWVKLLDAEKIFLQDQPFWCWNGKDVELQNSKILQKMSHDEVTLKYIEGLKEKHSKVQKYDTLYF